MSAPPFNVREDDILQISPVSPENKALKGCLLVVATIYSWGVSGIVLGRDCPPGRRRIYRIMWKDLVATGGRVQIPAPQSRTELPAELPTGRTITITVQ